MSTLKLLKNIFKQQEKMHQNFEETSQNVFFFECVSTMSTMILLYCGFVEKSTFFYRVFIFKNFRTIILTENI